MSEELKALPVGVRRVVHELRLSMQVFRDYGYQHQDKAESADDPKERAEREWKAKRNFDRAAACEDALDFFAASRTPTEAEPGEAEVADALKAAYIAGATDVHIYWRAGGSDSDPDFAEAASDYAADKIAALRSTRTRAMGSASKNILASRSTAGATIMAANEAPAVAVDDDALWLAEQARVTPDLNAAYRFRSIADRLQSLQNERDALQQALAETHNDRQSLQASVRVKDEALIDWRNCWLCPATNFDGEVERLLRVTDAALSDQQGGE